MDRIVIEVGGVSAEIALWNDLSPSTVGALSRALPMEGVLRHAKWSGQACFLRLTDGPLTEVDRIECPVTSIYPGVLVLRPGIGRPGGELLLSYGIAEYRARYGRDYVTPLGEVVGPREPLFEVLQRCGEDGRTQATLQARVTR